MSFTASPDRFSLSCPVVYYDTKIHLYVNPFLTPIKEGIKKQSINIAQPILSPTVCGRHIAIQISAQLRQLSERRTPPQPVHPKQLRRIPAGTADAQRRIRLNNQRSSTADISVQLTPPRTFTLEEALIAQIFSTSNVYHHVAGL